MVLNWSYTRYYGRWTAPILCSLLLLYRIYANTKLYWLAREANWCKRFIQSSLLHTACACIEILKKWFRKLFRKCQWCSVCMEGCYEHMLCLEKSLPHWNVWLLSWYVVCLSVCLSCVVCDASVLWQNGYKDRIMRFSINSGGSRQSYVIGLQVKIAWYHLQPFCLNTLASQTDRRQRTYYDDSRTLQWKCNVRLEMGVILRGKLATCNGWALKLPQSVCSKFLSAMFLPNMMRIGLQLGKLSQK